MALTWKVPLLPHSLPTEEGRWQGREYSSMPGRTADSLPSEQLEAILNFN